MGAGRRLLEGRNGRDQFGVTAADLDDLRKSFKERQVKTARFVVKRRRDPMLAVIVVYNPVTGREGKVLVSEPIRADFNNEDAQAAARRLAPQVPDYKVILPVGMEL